MGTVFALGRVLCTSWARFAALAAFRCRLWPVLVHPETLRARFWRVSGGPGEGFGGSKPRFFMDFQCLPTGIAKNARQAFRTVKTNTKRMSAIRRTLSKTTPKSIWGSFEQGLLRRSHARAALRVAGHDFGGLGDSLGCVLAVFWVLLGACRPLLDASWVFWGYLLDALGVLLGASCLSWTLPTSILTVLGGSRQGFGGSLGLVLDILFAC